MTRYLERQYIVLYPLYSEGECISISDTSEYRTFLKNLTIIPLITIRSFGYRLRAISGLYQYFLSLHSTNNTEAAEYSYRLRETFEENELKMIEIQ